MEREMERRIPSIIDLNAELAKLAMFHGLTPQTTRAERQGSATLLGPYRDGILFAGKNAGTSHWEDHAEDELVHVLDGTSQPYSCLRFSCSVLEICNECLLGTHCSRVF